VKLQLKWQTVDSQKQEAQTLAEEMDTTANSEMKEVKEKTLSKKAEENNLADQHNIQAGSLQHQQSESTEEQKQLNIQNKPNSTE
jgi:hypothetical protein